MKGGKSKDNDGSKSDAKLAVKKGGGKGKGAMDPNKPKWSPSAFFVFMGEFRKQYKEKHPNDKSAANIGKAAADKWRSMSDAEKSSFVKKDDKLKTQYQKNQESYEKGEPQKSADDNSEVEEEVNSESEEIASSKHHWTTIEDAKLVECLIDLAIDGKWKADNGTFRAGYVHEKLPGCSPQASPHIESRVNHMKKQYCAIAEMLGPNASWFGWNDELKCVVYDKDVFQDWVKIHPTVKGLRNKSFPYYDDLVAIFGKDRTKGEAGEAPADVVEAMEEEATNEVQVHGLDDIHENADVDENVCHSYATTEDASSSGRRTRKRTKTTESSYLESLVGVMKNMSKLYEETSASVAKIAKYFEIEAEWGSKRLNVFKEVSKVEGFSDGDMLRAGEILSRDAARANYFFTLPDGFRKLYLQGLLRSNN